MEYRGPRLCSAEDNPDGVGRRAFFLLLHCSTALLSSSDESELATCYGKTEGRPPSAASDGPFPSPRQRSVISAIRRSNSALKISRRRRCDPRRYGSSARGCAKRMIAWFTPPTPTCQRAGLLALNNPSTAFRSHRSRLMPIPAGGTKPPRDTRCAPSTRRSPCHLVTLSQRRAEKGLESLARKIGCRRRCRNVDCSSNRSGVCLTTAI
jgi:hypothetical protein